MTAAVCRADLFRKLARLQETMKQRRWAEDAPAQAFLREAKAFLVSDE